MPSAKPYLLLLLLMPLFGLAQVNITCYVSATGSDKNNGSINQPFATVEKAIAHIKQQKPAATKANIIIRQGTYWLKKSIEVPAAGFAPHLTIKAYNGEKVTLTVATPLPAAQWKPLSKQVYARLHPSVDGRKLLEFDVSKLTNERLKRFSPDPSFMEAWPSIDLYANQKRQPIAQWPNEQEQLRKQNETGWATYNGAKNNTTFLYAAGGRPEDKDTTNELELDGTNRATRWMNALNTGHEIWLKGFWRVPWGPITSKVKQMDNTSIELVEQPRDGMGSKYSKIASTSPLWRVGSGIEKWKLINALEEIDQPGEWALDVKDQKIYYYPSITAKALSVEIVADTMPVFHFKDASNISIEGLTIRGALSQAVRLEDCSNITIAGCTIFNTGGAGIYARGGINNTITSNTIYETGAAGIVMEDQGDRKKLIVSNSTIHNNHIYNIGKLTFSESIQLANSVGVKVSNNLLHDLPKSAIRTDLINNCIFEFNEIHNIALQEADNGAFYNYGGWSTYGNVFRFNFIHHINRSNGLYCDDGDSGDMFYNNIVHDAIEAIKFGGGHDNIARNNLIINSKSQNIDDRGINRNYKLNTPYEARLQEMKPYEEPWKSYGEQLKQQYEVTHHLWKDILKEDWKPEYPNGSKMIHNVTVASGPFVAPEKGAVTVEGNLQLPSIADAGFYNYALLDLRTDNAAILEKLPSLNTFFLQIGLQKDQYRQQLPTRKETGGLTNRLRAGNLANEDQFIEKKQ
ncbi:right-handed parallel beta-helix repeat-containing protein [Aridibaculum aurantiacum]|uniref:right-handed parallel beta-helix repeat-containing protein n=1 Tax=Aridibaculum aurantiacum TaxID=2810307 RepID=UPI001A95E4C1|nr:right-handed parallel beta-helix repeat-containing protein [Aridibaculum aurantiacum]